MTIEECCKKIEDFERKIKNTGHTVYYIDSSYCGTNKLHRWVEYGYICKYVINYISCCEFNVGVRFKLNDHSYLLEELYCTKEEAKAALDDIEKLGD